MFPLMKMGIYHYYKMKNACEIKRFYCAYYSTVTDFAKFLGLSTSKPLALET